MTDATFAINSRKFYCFRVKVCRKANLLALVSVSATESDGNFKAVLSNCWC